eukprot:scaffold689_cov333-Pavlova_lutheri.AAC.14
MRASKDDETARGYDLHFRCLSRRRVDVELACRCPATLPVMFGIGCRCKARLGRWMGWHGGWVLSQSVDSIQRFTIHLLAVNRRNRPT